MSSPAQQFIRRPDPSGMYASFCRRCLQTVATSNNQAKLAEGEKQHQCDGIPTSFKFSPARSGRESSRDVMAFGLAGGEQTEEGKRGSG